MGICLNSLDSEPKPECMRNTSVTSYLQMMRPLQFTLCKTFSGFWTTFEKLVDTLDLPSAWQKYKSGGRYIKEIPSFFIHNYKLEVIHEFVYLVSTITDSLSISSELNKRIRKAALTLSRLTK